MRPKRRYGTAQNLPGVQEMRAYRNSNQDVLIGVGIGAFVGNFAAGTIAAQTYVGIPWWFGTPTLPASGLGIPVYSIVPVLVTVIKHSTAPGAMTSIYAAAGVFASCVIPMGIIGLRKASRSRDKILQSDIHGSAHWAERHEIEEAGLLQKKKHEGPIARIKRLLRLKARQAGDVYDEKHTCYVGGWTDPKSGKLIYLTHTGPEHLLAHAPTRSGKGVGLVIPTLLAWRGSVLVHDIKGENHALTAGWRESIGQRVLRFSPTEPSKSCHFNPLDEIRKGTDREVSDVQNIATMIVDPDGKGLNDHWAKTSYSLLVATILHVLYCRDIKDKTLAAVGSLLSRPATEDDDEGDDKKKEGPNLSGVDEVFRQMIEYDHCPPENLRLITPDGTKTKTHKVIAESAQEMLNKAGNEKSGVISTAMSFLSLYRDPLVAETISKSDFSIHDLMNAETPLSLYLVVPPSDKDRLKPLIRLIINQVVRRLTEKMEFDKGRSVAKYKHRLLLMIDEFPSLGKLDIFEEALAFIAGYGLKAYLICQDTAQLIKSYTANESITSNCHVRIYYAPNRIETAEYISKQLGKQTLTTESHSVSYSGGGMMNFQTGSSGGIQHTGRELLTPDEVMRLPMPIKDETGLVITKPGAMITMSAGHAPILGKQIIYFLDPVFERRASILPSGMRQEDVEAALAQTENDISKIPPAPTIVVPAGPGWTAPDNATVVPVGVEIDSVTVDRGRTGDRDMTVESEEIADDGLPDIEMETPEIVNDSDDFPDFGADDEPEQIDGPEDTADILRDAHRIAAEKLAGPELDRAIRDEEGEQILIRSTAAVDRQRDKAQLTGFFS